MPEKRKSNKTIFVTNSQLPNILPWLSQHFSKCMFRWETITEQHVTLNFTMLGWPAEKNYF